MTATLFLAETANWGLAIAAAVIALATLIVSTIQTSRTLVRAADAQRVSNLENDLQAARDQVEHLEQRITACERGRAELKREVDRLRGVEVDLMRRLLKLEGG